MIYYLFMWIARHNWFSWVTIDGTKAPLFRAALAVLMSFVLVLVFGAPVIRWLMKQKVGDNPEFHNKTLNELTKHKGNTPTMGGLLIIGAILISTLLVSDFLNFYVIMGMFCLVYLAALGAIDDWLKLTTARRTPGSRDGLMAWEKLVFQVGLGMLLALFIYWHAEKVVAPKPITPTETRLTGGESSAAPTRLPDAPALTRGEFPVPKTNPSTPAAASIHQSNAVHAHQLNWPFLRQFILPAWAFACLTIIVITGTSNAVNLTDGMDGLAGGCMALVSFAFMALCYVTGDTRWAEAAGLSSVYGTGELAVICGAITGACLGFLWYNCNPAQVFMGDTGSLALGGVMGYVAIVIRQEPMLLLIGGIFVVEALSVMMQVSYFRMTGGKRIFLCSPIHHHFHLKGWSEQQVVVRFWLISALCAAFGLATVKLS